MGTKIETRVNFGEKYKDIITGFEGRVVAILKWQYGCIRIALRPLMGMDNKLPEEAWFDEQQLENINPIKKERGGPTPRPKMNNDPKR